MMTTEQREYRRQARYWAKCVLDNLGMVRWATKQIQLWTEIADQYAAKFGEEDDSTQHARARTRHFAKVADQQTQQTKINAARATHQANKSLSAVS